jgi:hypothetical protein
MFKKRIQDSLRRMLPFAGIELNRASVMQSLLRIEYDSLRRSVFDQTPNNPCLSGYKSYSQFDEDGIIEHIAQALSIDTGTFVEFGSGNGLENNTHLLLLKNWRGVWVDGSADNIRFIRSQLPSRSQRLHFEGSFVTIENVVNIAAAGLEALGLPSPDLLSMDLDGNDVYLLERLLQTYSPKIIVAEYNGKIPFGIRLTVPYAADAWRAGDDFFGASLSELVARLPDYRLVTCGLSGVNAFFVRKDLASQLPEHDPATLYQPARVHLTLMSVGSKPSLKFLAERLRQDR